MRDSIGTTELERARLLDAKAWAIIVVGAVITGLLALGAHDLALVRLNIPYPDETTVPGWARFMRYASAMIAVVVLCLLAAPVLARWRTGTAILLTSLILLGFNEVLRNVVIEWVISDGWNGTNSVYILTKHVPRSVGYVFQAAVAIGIVRYLLPKNKAFAMIALVAACFVGFYGLAPALKSAAAGIRTTFDIAPPTDLYSPPWPLHVYYYIYGTYLEPVAATLIMAAACWPRLGTAATGRIASFTAIILLLHGDIVTTFLYPAWSRYSLPIALASEAQFLTQGLLLGLLAGATWQVAARGQPARPR